MLTVGTVSRGGEGYAMVSDRGLEVLRVIVQDYVASREPVGSKTIVDRHSFGVSAATIRNDMAQLEDEELIAAPHTSSGRVPTDKGYRMFVDHLADRRPLSNAQRTAIETFLGASGDLDEVLHRTVRLLSQLTNQVALVQYPMFSRARVRHLELVSVTPTRVLAVIILDNGRVEQRLVETDTAVDDDLIARLRTNCNDAAAGRPLLEAHDALGDVPELIPERDRSAAVSIVGAVREQLSAQRQDRLVMAGAANLARTEDDFPGSIYPVLDAIEQQVVLLRLFGEMEAERDSVVASIGRENASFGLETTSVLAGNYRSSGGEIARLGVLGPTRMDYASNMAAVRAVARYLSRILDAE